ncbi:MAG: FAD-binding oxidoreductase [Veillonellales bacterium]
MDAQTVEQLKNTFGDRATTEEFELSFYQRDLAPIPGFLAKPLADTQPDIIIRPQSVEEVAWVVKLANERGIAITTRAGGSTVYFNAVCTRKGIILDMNGINSLATVDANNKVVRVGAGMPWWKLERQLNRLGLAACSYPSSAQSATIGGWLVMMGYGIGSLKYGSVREQVISAQVVLPDGSVRQLDESSDPPVSWLAASEGTLGIVTEVELKVRPYPETQWHGLAAFQNAEQMQDFIEAAAALHNKPFNLHFSDPGCNSLRQRLELASPHTGEVYTVAFDDDGSKAETDEAGLAYKRCLQAAKGRDLGSAEAEQEWQHRFYSLVLKREGPSLLGAEILLPINNLTDYLSKTAAFGSKQRMDFKSYGHIVSEKNVMIMTMFKADERDTIEYLQGLALVKKLHDIGAKFGGMPYGIGLWNTPYLNRCQTAKELAELKRRKQLLDPKNIMNPGKRYGAPLLLKPAFFKAGMDLLAASRRVYRGKAGRNQL